MLRNSWPTSRSCSPKSPAWRPLTYAVETCTQAPQRSPGRDLARQLDHPRHALDVDLARLLQRQLERDRGRAVDDPIDRADQPLRGPRRQPEPRLAADRRAPPAPAPRAGGRLVVEARQHRPQALARPASSSRARTSTTICSSPALDQPRERVHPRKPVAPVSRIAPLMRRGHSGGGCGREGSPSRDSRRRRAGSRR